jgi:rhodanese-related sulfurtransferase
LTKKGGDRMNIDTNTIINGLIIILAVWMFARRLFPAKGVRNISTNELKAEIEKNDKQFIDVRTPTEFRANHIRGFKNIPLHELKQRVHELSKDKEVVVICQSGIRSNQASKLLKKLGFSQVTNVKGGMNAWH